MSSLLLASSTICPAFAGGEKQFAEGMIAYNSKNYRVAAMKFNDSLNAGNGASEVYLYMAHSYAAYGETKKALEKYHDLARIFKGCPSEAIALKCIRHLDPRKQYKYVHPDATNEQYENVAKKTARLSLINRITVLPPTQVGHQAVSPSTVNAVKSAVRRLPKHLYDLLDQNEIRIFIAPNMSDKWPDAFTGATPGMEQFKMSQVPSRTYDKDIYIFERPTKNGITELDAPFKTPDIEREALYALGHTIDFCLNLTNNNALKKEYDLDVLKIQNCNREQLRYLLQPDYKGLGEVVASALLEINGDSKYHEFDKIFPLTYKWLKNRMDKVKTDGVATQIAHKPEDRRSSEYRHRKKQEEIAANTAAYLANVKKEKEFTFSEDPNDSSDLIPAEDQIPFIKDSSNRLFVNGTINGKAVKMGVDIGSHRVMVGKKVLDALNIKTPKTKAVEFAFDPSGKFYYWLMPLEISVGNIKRRVKALVPENGDIVWLGLPFFRGMNYRIDNQRAMILTNKSGGTSGGVGTGAAHQIAGDAIEIPFKSVGGKLEVVVKLEGKPANFFFNTGVHKTVLTYAQFEALGLVARNHVRKSSIDLIYRPPDALMDTVDLGPIRKTKFLILLGEQSVLGQDFFGGRHYVIDNEKKVIRFSRN